MEAKKNEALFSIKETQNKMNDIYKILEILGRDVCLESDKELTLASELLLYFEVRNSDLQELNSVLDIVKLVSPITESLKAISKY